MSAIIDEAETGRTVATAKAVAYMAVDDGSPDQRLRRRPLNVDRDRAQDGDGRLAAVNSSSIRDANNT